MYIRLGRCPMSLKSPIRTNVFNKHELFIFLYVWAASLVYNRHHLQLFLIQMLKDKLQEIFFV